MRMRIFHIILVGIPSSLILLGVGKGEYLTDKIAATAKHNFYKGVITGKG